MRNTTGFEDNKFGQEFLGQILDYIANNFEPEEVFDVDVLEQWAKDNGYESVD